MISSSDNTSDISSSSINTRNGDKARIGGNLTPTRRKKIKLLKRSPRESLHPNENVQFYNANTQSFGIKDGIQSKTSDADMENNVRKEKTNVGGSLDMLMDAIQVIECQTLHTSVGMQGDGKDLLSVLAENIKLGKNSIGRSSLQNKQFWESGGLEAAKELPLATQSWDGQNNPNGIFKAVDIDSDGGAMPRTRSKEGRLPTLPSKYSDSVLQPWKKVTRKVPKY